MGMSAVGKDRIQKELENHEYKRIVSTTTRPMRKNETDGVDYNFTDDKTFDEMRSKGLFVESRTYNTIQDGKPAVWKYAAPAVDCNADNYVIILDKGGTDEYIAYYGKDKCFTVLVKASNEIRKARAQKRGSFDLQEWNRRLADDERVFPDVNADLTVMNEGSIDDVVNVILDAAKRFSE
jgi:guanylate kinase